MILALLQHSRHLRTILQLLGLGENTGAVALSKPSRKAQETPHLLHGLGQASSILSILQQTLLLLQEVLGDVSLGRVMVFGFHTFLKALQESCMHWEEGLEQEKGPVTSY